MKVSSQELSAYIAGASQGQEATGQQWLSSAGVLPQLIFGKDVSRERLEQEWGVKFLHDRDNIFVYAKLPEGWTIEPDQNRGYWSVLRDENGGRRADIFYKDVYGDRVAQMAIATRFRISTIRTTTSYTLSVYDNKTSSNIREFGEFGLTEYKSIDDMYSVAAEWLENNYPDYSNPYAYWKE